MATLHDRILITDLEENFGDDPYGTTTYVIRTMLSRALSEPKSGLMSQEEFMALSSIAFAVVTATGGETIEPRRLRDVP